MKPSNELFKLIKSLSKSEKRFFKLSSSLQSGEKNYLKIFDVVEKQKLYDEGALKKAFKTERFIKHLPSEKNHLYKLILKSLRSFYSERSVSSILKQEIKNVEILYHKALYKECEKFVARAKDLAMQYERFYYWFELLSWEKKLLEEAFEAGEFDRDLDELVEEETIVIDRLRNLAEYQIIYSKINLIFRSGGFARNSKERELVRTIEDYHLIKGKNTAISTRAASMCYYIKGLCAATNRNYKDAFIFFNKTMTILDNNPKIKEDSPQRYLMTLSHIARCHLDENEFDLAQNRIEAIRVLDQERGFDSTDIEVKIFTNAYNLEVKMLQLKGEFDEAVVMLDKIEKQMNDYGDKVNKEQEVLFNYNKAYSYFGAAEYKKALSSLNNVLNDNEQNLRQDIYSFARVFNLVLHYELGNYDFLEYSIKSTNRYLNKQERTLTLESTLIKSLRKLSKTIHDADREKYFIDLKKEIKKLLEDENERVVTEYFHILAWVEGKTKGVAFSEAIKSFL
jgi:tetratricopeptide (TPR) repeat protein